MSVVEAPPAGGPAPSVTLDRYETAYVVRLDVSEIEPDELRVEVEDDDITVLGASFEESIRLPSDAAVQRLTAVYREGLLELHAPLRPSRATGRRNVEITKRHRVLQNPDATPC